MVLEKISGISFELILNSLVVQADGHTGMEFKGEIRTCYGLNVCAPQIHRLDQNKVYK